MSHSQTVQTRRRKQKAKKEVSRLAKAAEKLGKQNAKTPGADGAKKPAA